MIKSACMQNMKLELRLNVGTVAYPEFGVRKNVTLYFFEFCQSIIKFIINIEKFSRGL